ILNALVSPARRSAPAGAKAGAEVAMRSQFAPRVARLLPIAIASIVLLAPVRAQQGSRLTLDRLTAQPSVFGTSPISPAWSPDGEALAFAWNDAGLPLRDVWIARAASGAPTRLTDMAKVALEPEPSATDPNEQLAERVAARARPGVTAVAWAPDGASLAFVYRGDVYRIGRDGSRLKRVTRGGRGRADLQFSPDGAFISFLQDGDVWLWSTKTNEGAAATRIGVPPLSTIAGARYTRPAVEVSEYSGSPDSRRIAVQIDDRSRVRKVPIANFLPLDTEIKFVRRDYPGDHDWVRNVAMLAIADGRLEPIDLPDKTDRRINTI